jgi:hypothetical protein
MFKHIDVPVADGRIRQAWGKLIRKIQTDVEHKRVTNAAPSPRPRGEIVYAFGNNSVAPALAMNDAQSEWVGVWAEPVAGNGQGIIRYQGYAYVLFEDGLSLVGGTPAYISANGLFPGAATDIAPVLSKRIGTIANATGYIGVPGDGYNPYAWVWLGRCCTPFGRV